VGRYVVVGAGAIGGSVGALLSLAGRAVVLVARGEHLAALRASGCELGLPDRIEQVDVDACALSDVVWQPDDVVLLCVKSQHTSAVLAELPSLPTVCMQNGIVNERRVAAHASSTYGAMVWSPASLLRPGRVAIYSAPCRGVIDVGRYPSGTDATVERLVNDLGAAGFETSARDEIMRDKTGKLLANLGNAVQALAGMDGLRSRLRQDVIREGEEVLKAASIDYRSVADLLERCNSVVSDPVFGEPRGGGSSWQSLARGCGDIETDYLNGEVVLIGERIGVATPLNRALCAVANRAAAEGWAAGALGADELETLIARECD
jgi:2-dehydropantoate 2-reductase